ncbi:energy transducer TonB [Polaribacter sargassicola]|uniref:energy transducer TonB n=1 Tax=Polaribacter sargassicola TaxID=2836891 RepID=UPI001F402986|nr:energy transducer TonB [Polaribacter sp. DS7-9]MCG1035361.1 energy transducer TonB [Polaribacter sp. DS7-9]
MKSKFKITIPKPCHQDWNKMTQKEKGRFCSSCSKTVIDFTKKSAIEITDYLTKNKDTRVCGHFYKKQLDSIIIEIPQVTFKQELSFEKLFILALFFVMGTTLFSCQYADGKKQKIQEVIIVDTINKIEKEIDSLKEDIKQDSIIVPKLRTVPPPPSTVGLTICNTNKEESRETIITTGLVEELQTDGEIELIEIEEEEIIMGLIIEEPPKFKEAKENTQKDFSENIKEFFAENFNSELVEKLDLKEGKHKIYTEFSIDKNGYITDIKIRTPYSIIKEEVLKTFKKLPQFIPGKQAGKIVKTKYNLPITLIIE